MNEALISELFNSIQGEGLYVGERQTFIRFAGCNLSCQYCDSPQALVATKEFQFEATPGKKDWQKFQNPAQVGQLVELAATFQKLKGATHSVSLTGGEPLLQADFLQTFIPELKKAVALPVYLETNGVLPQHLEAVIELVDIIALDIKLPSATGSSPYWKEHQRSIEVGRQQELFVKIVFTRESTIKELDEAVTLIAAIDPAIPLVLQPVTPHGAAKHRPGPEQIFAFQALAKRKLAVVKVIPQVHKLFGVM